MADDHAVQSYYKKQALSYDKRWARFSTPVYDWVLHRFADTVSDNTVPRGVLDLACGTGAMLRLIKNSYDMGQYKGLDFTPDMLTYARIQDDAIQYEAANLNEMLISAPVDWGLFDNVLCLNVLHHLQNPEKFLEQLATVVTSGTNIYISAFALDTLSMRLGDLYWRFMHRGYSRSYSSSALCSLLESQSLFEMRAQTVIKPNWFWRLQLYHLYKP